jgi:hypothetical protein
MWSFFWCDQFGANLKAEQCWRASAEVCSTGKQHLLQLGTKTLEEVLAQKTIGSSLWQQQTKPTLPCASMESACWQQQAPRPKRQAALNKARQATGSFCCWSLQQSGFVANFFSNFPKLFQTGVPVLVPTLLPELLVNWQGPWLFSLLCCCLKGGLHFRCLAVCSAMLQRHVV